MDVHVIWRCAEDGTAAPVQANGRYARADRDSLARVVLRLRYTWYGKQFYFLAPAPDETDTP